MKPYQKVNHFPAMYCIAHKNHLGRNLMKLRRILPKEYSFFPQTWLLPSEGPDFKKAFIKDRTFILKPEALSQGKGIFLTNTSENVNFEEHYVAQRYISKPFLIDGLKFDLRVYALVYGSDPLRIYIFHEGLARLATEPYMPPNPTNLSQLFIHLTNYAINKESENFIFNTDADKADVGHKRSLSFVWNYIDLHGGNSEVIKSQIEQIIVKTLCAVQPLLAHSYKSAQPLDYSNSKCFEILGFDILIDHKLKPWLLEVNHSPSFTTDTPFDLKIKEQLITDTVKLLNMNIEKRMKYFKKLTEKSKLCTNFSRPHKTKEELLLKKQHKMEKRDTYELANLGGFRRIYPSENSELNENYTKILQTAKEVWEEFTGARRTKELLEKREELRTKELKALPGKKSKIIPKNRKPLYYIKNPIQKKPIPDTKEEIFDKKEEELCEPEGENEHNVEIKKENEFDEDIVDKIAKKYNIVGIFCIL